MSNRTGWRAYGAAGKCARILTVPIDQDAVRLVREIYGIDMEAEGQRSKLVCDIPDSDVAISMGCNVGRPFVRRPFDDDWGLEDPAHGRASSPLKWWLGVKVLFETSSLSNRASWLLCG